jgi:Xaa-Pro aminopeptidase
MKPAVTRAKAYLKVRHKTVRDAIKELKLDGLLLTRATDLAYLTNFTGDESVGLITAKDLYIITDFRYRDQAQLQAGWTRLMIRDGDMADTIARAILDAGLRRVGFEANFTTYGQVSALDKAIRELLKAHKGPQATADQVELVPLEDVMPNIRKVKDDHEIDLIRKSVALAEEAFEAIRAEIKVGQTENYLAGLLIAELRARGAQTTSFEPIVASGANSALPHYRPGDVLVQRDQPLLFDWGAVYNGYCSDLTRTFLIGHVAPGIKQIYQVVYEAQQVAIRFLRPGVTTRQADRVARDLIEKAGYRQYFGHGLGHGIGRDIHELPTMRYNAADEELRPGMIVTVEPGIYLPGEGGVRIEDDVLITHSGCEVLSSMDKTFEACHIV